MRHGEVKYFTQDCRARKRRARIPSHAVWLPSSYSWPLCPHSAPLFLVLKSSASLQEDPEPHLVTFSSISWMGIQPLWNILKNIQVLWKSNLIATSVRLLKLLRASLTKDCLDYSQPAIEKPFKWWYQHLPSEAPQLSTLPLCAMLARWANSQCRSADSLKINKYVCVVPSYGTVCIQLGSAKLMQIIFSFYNSCCTWVFHNWLDQLKFLKCWGSESPIKSLLVKNETLPSLSSISTPCLPSSYFSF